MAEAAGAYRQNENKKQRIFKKHEKSPTHQRAVRKPKRRLYSLQDPSRKKAQYGCLKKEAKSGEGPGERPDGKHVQKGP